MQLSPEDEKKLRISGFALIPFVVTLLLCIAVLYGVNGGRSLFRDKAGWDVALWVGATVVYYGLSVGTMYVPWQIAGDLTIL
jgi:hypothetical protein